MTLFASRNKPCVEHNVAKVMEVYDAAEYIAKVFKGMGGNTSPICRYDRFFQLSDYRQDIMCKGPMERNAAEGVGEAVYTRSPSLLSGLNKW